MATSAMMYNKPPRRRVSKHVTNIIDEDTKSTSTPETTVQSRKNHGLAATLDFALDANNDELSAAIDQVRSAAQGASVVLALFSLLWLMCTLSFYL